MFDLKVYGRRHMPNDGAVLIVSNHQSYLDPVLLCVQLRRPLHYIAKSELFKNRAAAWFLRWVNAFPVRQGAADVGAVKQTIHRLKTGHLMNIFPEGSRTPDGQILPLQKGVALIIKRSGVSVIPAVIVGAYEAWPIHRTFPRMWPVRIRFGRPINLNGMQSDEEMIAAIDRRLRQMFEQMQRRFARPQSDRLAIRILESKA